MTRSMRFTRSSLLAAALLALAGCGGTEVDDPSQSMASAKVPRGVVIRVVPDVPMPTEGFGAAVAVSGTALAVADFVGFPHAHVHTYAISGTTAVETGTALRPDSGEETCFGEALALEGDLLVVGAPCADEGAGAVYVYGWERATESWTRTARLAAPVAGPAAFGRALALRPHRLAVGAPHEGGYAGAVHVYARTRRGLALEASIVPADGAPPDLFGWTLSLSGEELAVGAPGRTSVDPLVGSGRVHLFARANGLWTQGETLLPCSCQIGERVGWSVALAPGVVAVAGDRFVSHSVHVYELGAAGWEENDVEEALHGQGDAGFVHEVAIDGDLLVIGTPTLNGPAGEYRPGAATIHRRSAAGVWPRILEVGTGVVGDKVGHAVSVSGGLVAVGAPGTYLVDALGTPINLGSGAALVVRP